jgi:hypothetical protein
MDEPLCAPAPVQPLVRRGRRWRRSDWLQLSERGPESLAVWPSHPILSELICGRAPRANDSAFTRVAVQTRTNLPGETVRRAGLRGAARLEQGCKQEGALVRKLVCRIDELA